MFTEINKEENNIKSHLENQNIDVTFVIYLLIRDGHCGSLFSKISKTE